MKLWWSRQGGRSEPRGVMARLARDRAGNTIALMAAVMIPMAALAGSAIDMARLYVVKVRLQQACDAGALAGRKFMSDAGSTLDTTATTQAKTFFANNFSSGYMNTPAFTASSSPYPFTPSKTADNQVAGTASVSVPMTLMKMFGFAAQTISVSCQARYDIADTDVMFVLDTTGSMSCLATDSDSDCNTWVGNNSGKTYTRPSDNTTGYYVGEKTNSKISGVRSAVLSFYDTVAANVDSATHVRYGFVTYSSTVNVGKVLYGLSSNYLVSSWNYQSRIISGDANNGSAQPASDFGNSNGVYTGVDQNTCSAYNNMRSPTTGWRSDGTATRYSTTWTSYNGGTCTGKQQPLVPLWTYQQTPFDVSQFVQGNSVDDPSKVDSSTAKWQGCVEERDTTASSSFDLANLPPDLDPDLIPSSAATRWRPHWPEVIYYRGTSGNPQSAGDSGSYPSLGNAAYQSAGYSSCGKAVQRLAVLSRSDVSNYVNATDFKPQGGTYHDVGMIWGTRMISPNGVFASDTSTWPGRNSPNRYIVFMTDGSMAPSTTIYGQYGVELYDQRVTGGTFGSQTDYHNTRFVTECAAAKARNISVFVIGFGQTLNSQLTSCASPGQAYYASDNAALTTAFKKIATQVARLRISQ